MRVSKISEALDKGNKLCAFAEILSNLDKEDIDAILNGIHKGKSGYAVSEALYAGGYKISPSTISKHIKKGCKCYGEN